MKKVIAVLAAVVVAMAFLAVSAPVFTPVFADETVTTGEETVGDGGETEYVRLTGDGFDPYATFAFSEKGANAWIDPDTVTWAAIRYRMGARYNETNVEYIAQVYVSPAAEPFVPVHYRFTDGWDTLIVDMTSVAALYGRESIWDSGSYRNTEEIRLDPLEPDRDAENFDDSTGRGIVTEGDYVDIAWIAFFEKEEDAKAYTGKEDTPYCILDAGSLSSPYTIHNLKAEYMGSKPVEDPDATEEPAGEVAGPSALFAFTYEDDVNDALLGGSKNLINDVYFGEKCYVIEVAQGGDPYQELSFGTLATLGDIDEISADENKVVQLAVRVDTAAGGKNGSLYWQTDENPGYSEAQNQTYKYEETDGIQLVTIDFSRVRKWTGTVGNLRYDMFFETAEDTSVELYYAAFFKDAASAKAFGEKFLAEGLPATPAPTEAPTATPAPEATEPPVEEPTQAPVEEPTNEPAAEPTDAPVATEAPKKKGCGSALGGISAVVVLAAAGFGAAFAMPRRNRGKKE